MLKLGWQQYQLVLLIILSGSLSNNNVCNGIRLNPNGGYDIVVSVEDNVQEPANTKIFLDEIRIGMESFSAALLNTTNGRFFIRSVDILVPSNWWTVSNFETATWQTLLDSEIRITSGVAAPHTVNPNPCGKAGLHMELPEDFFKMTGGGRGQYGPISKALVSLWARYRFGVWEEHGIPGDAKFPYFYKNPSFESKWEATGCSNEEIIGDFRTVEGNASERCDPLANKRPDDDCRFIPSSENTVNSSLLHFHWLDSITQFCDDDTHNYVAPNRHNLFCGHRSVWDVIRQSWDYQNTHAPTDPVAPPQFRILKESSSPEFYILLDRGQTYTPEQVIQELMETLDRFVNTPSLERINIAVGTYPNENQFNYQYYVKEEVGWAPMYTVYNDIQRVLNESSKIDGPLNRDAGLAIKDVVEEIKRRNHLAGSVILVVKRGAGPNTFSNITYEQEVIASAREDSRIKVYAIEAQQDVAAPYANLQNLAEETKGKYHLIDETTDTARNLQGFLGNLQEVLEQSSIMNSVASWVIQKQYTEPNQEIDIPIYDDVTLVTVHLTTNRHMTSEDIQLDQVVGDHNIVITTEKGEWDENSDTSRRSVFTYSIRNPTQGSRWVLKHGCHTEDLEECRSFLVVTAETTRPTPHKFLFNSNRITVDVTTSAQDNWVDLGEPAGVKVVPFAVFAKVEMDGQQRVLGVNNVTAMIRRYGDQSRSWVVQLQDNGEGLPDVEENDGIYSGLFTPGEDGLYQISVSAQGLYKNTTGKSVTLVNHAGSLMPVNQVNFGCNNSTKFKCLAAIPTGNFSRVQDMAESVAVVNAALFKPTPLKILDFKATLQNSSIQFQFTSPNIIGSDASVYQFRIYMGSHVQNFTDFSIAATKLITTVSGQPSGTRVTLLYGAPQTGISFYAVRAVYGEQQSGPSNVVGVVHLGEPPVTTTTTQPTSTPTTAAGTVLLRLDILLLLCTSIILCV